MVIIMKTLISAWGMPIFSALLKRFKERNPLKPPSFLPLQAGPLRGARAAGADEGGAVGDAGGADADAVPAQELGRAAQGHREATLTAQPEQVGKIQYNFVLFTCSKQVYELDFMCQDGLK